MTGIMQILVDADACPVKGIIVRLAKEKNIPVTMLIAWFPGGYFHLGLYQSMKYDLIKGNICILHRKLPKKP